jgi:hypothetical protein
MLRPVGIPGNQNDQSIGPINSSKDGFVPTAACAPRMSSPIYGSAQNRRRILFRSFESRASVNDDAGGAPVLRRSMRGLRASAFRRPTLTLLSSWTRNELFLERLWALPQRCAEGNPIEATHFPAGILVRMVRVSSSDQGLRREREGTETKK